MSLPSATRRALLAGLCAGACASAAAAQSFPVKFYGASAQQLRGGVFAIPAYQISYFT